MISKNLKPTFQRAASESPCHWTGCRHCSPEYRHVSEKSNGSQAFPAQLANFGLSESKQPLTEPHVLTNAQCSQLHVLHLRWGRSNMETPRKMIIALHGFVATSGLAAGLCRVSTAPLRNRVAWYCKPRGQTRRKDLNAGSKCLACVRVVWEDSDVVRHRPMVFCLW
jgi:hypothetical protein